jgi:hypothetical protein
MADTTRQKLRLHSPSLLATKTGNQQLLYASRPMVVWGKFVNFMGF